MKWLRKLVLRWLGILVVRDGGEVNRLDLAESRLKDVSRHFVTQRDPKTGQPTETLADRHLKQDGKPPEPQVKRSHNWPMTRRKLELAHAGVRARPMPRDRDLG